MRWPPSLNCYKTSFEQHHKSLLENTIIMEKSKIKQLVANAIQNTHAYDDVHGSGNKSKKTTIEAMMQRWAKATEGRMDHQINNTWQYYYEQCRGNTKREEYHEHALATLDPTRFKVHPSDEKRHLAIKDSRGIIIAYRVRLPGHHLDALSAAEDLIPVRKPTKHQRGSTVNCHWGMWSAQSGFPMLSWHYHRDNKHGVSRQYYSYSKS